MTEQLLNDEDIVTELDISHLTLPSAHGYVTEDDTQSPRSLYRNCV